METARARSGASTHRSHHAATPPYQSLFSSRNRSKQLGETNAHAIPALAEMLPVIAPLAAAEPVLDPLLSSFAFALTGLPLIGLMGVRFASVGLLDYIKTAMITKYVDDKGYRVLQLGGRKQDIFAYRLGTASLLVVTPDTPPKRFEEAGKEVKMKVSGLNGPVGSIPSLPDEAVDIIISFNQLNSSLDLDQHMKEILRILKPGGRFVMLQKIESGDGLVPLLRIFPGSDGTSIELDKVLDYLEAGEEDWESIKWDLVIETQDPHALALGVKKRRLVPFTSVDERAFMEQMKRSKKNRL